MEHKSSPDDAVAFQLLRHIVRIWEKHARESKGTLPPILPLVFYHGSEKWNVPPNLAATIELGDAEALRPYSPDLRYLLCDLRYFDPAELSGSARLRLLLLAMKYVFSPDMVEKLAEVMRVLRSFPREDRDAIESMRTVLIYWSKARGLTKEDVSRALDLEHSEEVGEVMSTVLDAYREEGIQLGVEQGLKQGIEQGIEQGKQREAVRLSLRLLQAKFSPVTADIEQSISALPLELIEDLGVALLGFHSLEDLASWMEKNVG